MINRTNKKLISFSNRNLDMMDALMEETGWDTPTQIVKRGIEELYRQTFKYGKDPIGSTEVNTEENLIKKAIVKVKAKKLIKEAEDNAKLQPKIDFCLNNLLGQVETNEGGYKFCRFTTYTLKDDQSQLLSIKQMDPILLETSLFSPSKEAVFKHRPAIKKLFNK